jgi:hypothetical protein
MSDTDIQTSSSTPELKGLRDQCLRVAEGLFSHARAADRAIEALFSDIPPALKHPNHRATLEAWLLAELVFRARRHARAVAMGEQLRRERNAPPNEPAWWQLHERGELLPLLQQLPRVYAEAFTLQYIDKVPLREMMRRTGASAGVITHRVKEAVARLDALASGGASSRHLQRPPGETRSKGESMQRDPARFPTHGEARSCTCGCAQ